MSRFIYGQNNTATASALGNGAFISGGVSFIIPPGYKSNDIRLISLSAFVFTSRTPQPTQLAATRFFFGFNAVNVINDDSDNSVYVSKFLPGKGPLFYFNGQGKIEFDGLRLAYELSGPQQFITGQILMYSNCFDGSFDGINPAALAVGDLLEAAFVLELEEPDKQRL